MRIGTKSRIDGGLRHCLLGTLAVCLSASASAGDSTSCEDCHSDPKFFVEYQKLYRYYQDWLSSPHRRGGVTCDDCHGGDPAAPEKVDAHEGVMPVSDPRSGLFYRNQPETCGECHKKESRQFEQSEHYRALVNQHGAPTCSTCHSAMNRKPYYRDIVENTCRVCHYENNDDDLPPVADKANEILHRLNIAKGYMNWTRTHFQAMGWPGETRQLVKSLTDKYQAIITRGHTFELEDTEQASIDLLSRLKAVYRQTEEEVQRRSGP